MITEEFKDRIKLMLIPIIDWAIENDPPISWDFIDGYRGEKDSAPILKLEMIMQYDETLTIKSWIDKDNAHFRAYQKDMFGNYSQPANLSVLFANLYYVLNDAGLLI
jgi:hypothetical protein